MLVDALLLGWPFVGVVVGVVGLGWLLIRKRHRSADPAWLSCLMLPMYMVHQFEEHGLDLLGRRYHFMTELCATLHRPLDDCPADPVFIFAVNVGSVWIAGGTAIAFRRTMPRVGVFALGIPLVNAFAHINPAIRSGAYNSGLATSIILFLPICFFALRGFVRGGTIQSKHLPLVVLSGILLHAVLLGSLILPLPSAARVLIQLANGFLPLVFAFALKKPRA